MSHAVSRGPDGAAKQHQAIRSPLHHRLIESSLNRLLMGMSPREDIALFRLETTTPGMADPLIPPMDQRRARLRLINDSDIVNDTEDDRLIANIYRYIPGPIIPYPVRVDDHSLATTYF